MNYDPAPFMFLRPHWLLMLVLVPVLVMLLLRALRAPSPWTKHIDPHLQDALLERPKASNGIGRSLWLAVMLSTIIVALAGPSFRQSEEPLWNRNVPLVVVAEMSADVMQQDIQPNRLNVMRAKMGEVFDAWEGDVGFVAYADQPFVVTPMTEDAANAAIFLDQLSPSVMPRNGKNPALAIDYAVDLIRRDGQVSGAIWLLATGTDSDAVRAASRAKAQGFTVSVMGIGSAAGLDEDALGDIADAGGGRYVTVTENNADLRKLDLENSSTANRGAQLSIVKSGHVRQDNGFWLLPILLILGLFAFRRRESLAALFVVASLMLHPAGPAMAQSVPAADLWRTQQQQYALQARKADAAYRSGDYAKAATLYAPLTQPRERYNYANALAKSGRLQESINVYKEAIASDPSNTDAKINKAIVEAALKAQLESFKKPPEKPKSKQNLPPRKSDQEAKSDAQKKAEAERKAREELEKAKREAKDRKDDINPATNKPYTAEERRARGELDKQLKNVEDDPGGLLRAKFYLEYIRRFQRGDSM